MVKQDLYKGMKDWLNNIKINAVLNINRYIKATPLSEQIAVKAFGQK